MQGKTRARHQGDWYYILGREFDSISRDPATGKYYLGEIKFRAGKREVDDSQERRDRLRTGRIGNGGTRMPRGGGAGQYGPGTEQAVHFALMANPIREALFDTTASGKDLTLRGPGIPGGSVTLKPGEYEIEWIIVNSQGSGFGANVQHVSDMLIMLEEIFPEM